ncbi:MAG TPA: FHA domain-containing protein, partial [Archangium sp.]
MAKKTITLHITNPDGSVTEQVSELESIIVGSGSGASVKVTDPKVSNLHCMFKVEKDGNVTVIDLGSESGTKFKDQAVKEPTVVASGETVMIGESKVKVVHGETKAEEAKVEAKTEDKKEEKQDKKDKKKKDKGEKHAPSTKALAGTGKNAAALFNEPLPAEAVPTDSEKMLQVALLWGDTLINVQHFAEGVPVTIGDAQGNRFTVYNAGPTFTLAQSRGSTAVVNVPSDAGLVVTTKSDSHKSKEQLKTEGKLKAADGGVRGDAVELALHDRAQVSFNDVAFIIRYVRPTTHVTANVLEDHDFTFFKITSICLMAFFALVAAMVLTPMGFGGEGDDIFANPSKYVKMMVKPEKKVEIKKFKDLSGVAEGAKAKEKEGKFGKQDSKKQDADPSKKRADDQKKVSNLMASMFGGSSKSVFEGGLGKGLNTAIGGLQGGAGVGDAQGVGGLGSRGSGSGGGGTGLGLGGLG